MSEEEGEEKVWKLTFWHVAGLAHKDMDFLKKLEEWEVMILVET